MSTELSQEPEDSPMAEMLHITLRTLNRGDSGEEVFDARIFHVWLPSRAKDASHLLGICRGESHGVTASSNERKVHFDPLWDAQSQGESGSLSASSSRRGGSGSRFRASFDALGAELGIVDSTNEWNQLLGSTDDFVGLKQFLGDEFVAWLQPIVNEVLLGGKLGKVRFSRIRFRDKGEGLDCTASCFVDFPDPLVAYDDTFDVSYAVILSLDNVRARPVAGKLDALSEQ